MKYIDYLVQFDLQMKNAFNLSDLFQENKQNTPKPSVTTSHYLFLLFRVSLALKRVTGRGRIVAV